MLLSWLLPVVVGAGIGWATNWVALKMLFHPRRRTLGFQGLLPRRQADLARDVGRIVATELVRLDDLLVDLDRIDLRSHLEEVLDAALERKVAELRSRPILGLLLRERWVDRLRAHLLSEILAEEEGIRTRLKEILRSRLDIGALAEAKLAGFDLDRLEAMTRAVARTEFRAIEAWGALLGALIGLAQAAIARLL